MQSLFDRLGKAASSAATNAASKAEEMREINKLKNERTELKNEYTSVKKKLSEYVHITPYFNMKTLEEDVHVTKFDQPNDTFPYVLIDIY